MAEQYQVDRTAALYERPAITIQDPVTYEKVQQAVTNAFAPGNVRSFLKSLERSSLRIRDYEAVLAAGKLGAETKANYTKLSDGDQGLIRELYLALLEKVELKLRDEFFKLYAYY
jgi:hypothetical protein